jgi:hypothetical protein
VDLRESEEDIRAGRLVAQENVKRMLSSEAAGVD